MLALDGLAGVGGGAEATGATDTATASMTTKGSGSTIIAVGNDSSAANLRTVPQDQAKVEEWVDLEAGATFWVQGQRSAAAGAGTLATLAARGGAGSHWNMAAIELLSAAANETGIAIDD